MNSATQFESGFLVHHFYGGTPMRGEWEYQPSPVGLKIIEAKRWVCVEKGKEKRGRETQTSTKGRKKHKGIQTKDVTEEEKIKWEEERRRSEKEEEQKNRRNFRQREMAKAKTNKDRYREWMIRARIRMKKEKDEEIIRSMEILQKWVEEKERKFEEEESQREAMEVVVPESIGSVDPLSLIEESNRELMEEIALLEEALANVPPTGPITGPRIVEDKIFEPPSTICDFQIIDGKRQIVIRPK